VCSQFDFKNYGDPDFLHLREGNRAGTRDVNNCLKDGKMEKSFVNFRENHPDCKMGVGGEWLLASVQDFSAHRNEVRLQDSMNEMQASQDSLASIMERNGRGVTAFQNVQSGNLYASKPLEGFGGSGGGMGDTAVQTVQSVGMEESVQLGVGENDGLTTPAESQIDIGTPPPGAGGEAAFTSGGGGYSSRVGLEGRKASGNVDMTGSLASSMATSSMLQFGSPGPGNMNLLASSLGASTFRMPSGPGQSMMGSSSHNSSSMALMKTLTDTAHENNFFWLQEYHANQKQKIDDDRSRALPVVQEYDKEYQEHQTPRVARAANLLPRPGSTTSSLPPAPPPPTPLVSTVSYASASPAVRDALLKEATDDL